VRHPRRNRFRAGEAFRERGHLRATRRQVFLFCLCSLPQGDLLLHRLGDFLFRSRSSAGYFAAPVLRRLGAPLSRRSINTQTAEFVLAVAQIDAEAYHVVTRLVALQSCRHLEFFGFDVLRRIRAESSLPVLMLTAKGNPLDRVLAYLDFRKALLKGSVPEFTCLVGTMVQEVYATHPDIRRVCEASIGEQADRLEADIADAMTRYRVRASWTAKSLALHIQAVLQGAFILAKAKGSAAAAVASVDHLRCYIELLFGRSGANVKRKPKRKT